MLARLQNTQVVINQILGHKKILRKNISLLLRNISVQGVKDVNLEIHGETFKFPYVWLRDNCQCDKCFHQSARSRIIDWSKFNVDVEPKSIKNEEDAVAVTWNDGHTSRFELNWLKMRSFTRKYQKKYEEEVYRPKKIIWNGREFEKVCSKYDYNAILQSDDALHDWLHKLSVYGVALIQNTPNVATASDAVIDRIGFTKQTHYGVKFVVHNVPNANNVAYLSTKLQMHSDLPYYEYCPGVNMLHCLEQTDSRGGENLLTDCHFVANYMKENFPQQYKYLTDTEVEWSDVGTENGNEFYKLYRAPVIVLDKRQEIVRINFSIPQRGSHFPGHIQDVTPWYKAHATFLLLNNKFSAKFKTKVGDILAFDNLRMLHGRNAYEDSTNNVRKLIGAFVDWDEIYSSWRCLNKKLNKN